VTGYVIAVCASSLPGDFLPIKAPINALTARILVAANLWQSWDMFAPSPRSDDIKFSYIYQLADGTRTEVSVTDMVSMPYFERWQKERWRKFFNDHLRTDAEAYLWSPYVNYVVKDLRSKSIEPVQIELVRYWRAAETPINPSLRASKRSTPWMKYMFYRWRSSESQR